MERNCASLLFRIEGMTQVVPLNPPQTKPQPLLDKFIPELIRKIRNILSSQIRMLGESPL